MLFSDTPGYLRETDHNAIMERVDDQGNILGFSVLSVSQISKENPLYAQLIGQNAACL